MSEETNMAERVISYFDEEFESIRDQLESGQLLDYKERVIVSRKIDEALSRLSPYVRSEWRARQVVKSGETLRERLLSVRDIISNPPI
ncbi:hypothetical protein KI809_07035 [Geobacter pelophilus]|jgi:hypothetical protein|uniref:Uncharacterized protein n=1 Tax=Geoanaerobacter pelophilus TaxID=60036 RepID=A0AAW4KZH7_9BACT|nr:hypothetical protein [Geoanaerobacter pelophilus]MBT0664053.1 hypothetical protein [Geoanaerobacter pelophilus]